MNWTDFKCKVGEYQLFIFHVQTFSEVSQKHLSKFGNNKIQEEFHSLTLIITFDWFDSSSFWFIDSSKHLFIIFVNKQPNLPTRLWQTKLLLWIYPGESAQKRRLQFSQLQYDRYIWVYLQKHIQSTQPNGEFISDGRWYLLRFPVWTRYSSYWWYDISISNYNVWITRNRPILDHCTGR